jgi:hypothetical protein
MSTSPNFTLNSETMKSKLLHGFLILMLAVLVNSNKAFATESIVKVSNGLSQTSAYAGGSFLVKIRIERRNLDSFFQIQQELPAGMTATGVESQGATFLFKDGKVKYSWLRLPAEEDIQVIYKVKIPFTLKGNYEIKGSYYYINNEEKEVFPLPGSKIEILENVSPSDTVAERNLLSIINNEPSKPAYVAEEKPDLSFKIQILSSTRKLDRDSIRKVYKMKIPVVEENYNGLYKYTVGSFVTYEEARDFKNSLDFQKYIPFVIAYNRGARITVGEAMQLAARRKTIVK